MTAVSGTTETTHSPDTASLSYSTPVTNMSFRDGLKRSVTDERSDVKKLKTTEQRLRGMLAAGSESTELDDTLVAGTSSSSHLTDSSRSGDDSG